MEGNNNRFVSQPKDRCNSSSNQLEQIEMHGSKQSSVVRQPPTAAAHSCLPMLFERSKGRTLNPSFDSSTLEQHFNECFFPQSKRRFRSALVYVMVSCAVWVIFFACTRKDNNHWITHIVGACVLALMSLGFLVLTKFNLYQRHSTKFSITYSVILCLVSLLRFAFIDFASPTIQDLAMSSVGSFCLLVQIVLLLYNLLPLPFYLAALLSIIYSITYEVVFMMAIPSGDVALVIGTILLHACIHLLCMSLYLMATVRRHSTFSRIGQSTRARRALKREKEQQDNLIFSLMPVKVAKEAINSRNTDKQEDDNGERAGSAGVERGPIVFRQFTMDRMENVSILFADIVGFTKMSSNKTAEQLLKLLNELFGQFDSLSVKNNCEKISTLGDCYYCVSGCPIPDVDHARNCVNLGLDMVDTIHRFDEKHSEEVNMRVGIHTGTVLCGIVGTRRFKFDVWSHDVDLANVMESTGQPGRVHISEATYNFLDGDYEVTCGETVQDTRKVRNLTEQYDQETCKFGVQQVEFSGVTKTYFIIGPKIKGLGNEKNDSGCVSSATSLPATPHASSHLALNGVATAESSSKDNDTAAGEEERIDLILADKSVLINDVHVTIRRPVKTAWENAVHPYQEEEDRKEMQRNATVKNEEFLDEHGDSELAVDPDVELILAMKEQNDSKYFFDPPVHKCTMNFLDPEAEKSYRGHTAREFLFPDVSQTFASSRFNVFLDILVSTAFYILLQMSMVIVYQEQVYNSIAWQIYLAVSLCFVLCQVILITISVCASCFQPKQTAAGEEAAHKSQPSKFNKMIAMFYSWVPSHVLGVVQLTIPLGVVYSSYSCSLNGSADELYFTYALLTAMVHSINFNLLNSVVKSVIALIAGIALVLLANLQPCQGFMQGRSNVKYEIIVAVILLLVLIWFMNKEIEAMTRLAYNGDMQASNDRMKLENEKVIADSLLHDILPVHVADVLKLEKKYSQSHTDVGVIFISITNFDEFYDESFEGGKEFLRVLNELFSDYETLFDQEAFKDIEKIKTIGSTFMAASGLDQSSRDSNPDPKDHLYALMDFCIAIIDTVNTFNEGMFNFDFTLKIGYHVGEVVSGVLGTSKLHFDIWGNTVNVSSRMYSTGVKGRVQVTEETAKMLEDRYEFEYRDTISIKGKGMMRTYLMVKKKQDVMR